MSKSDDKADPPAAEEPLEDQDGAEGDEDDDAPGPTRGQAVLRMVVLFAALLALVEVGARIAFHVHRSHVNEASAADYPPGTFIADFAAKADYRFINFYTIDPTRGNVGAYEFDAYGFRLDKRKLRFDGPVPYKKIWFLGGSTVQGLGVLGDETVAAYLNDLLEKSHSEYRAINMGQGGYTSTQELLLLVELLQAGQRPDLILSYDGATEVPFSGDASKTGTPQWEKQSPKTRLLSDIQGDESVGSLFPFTLSRLSRVDDIMLSLRRRMNPAADTAFEASNWDVVVRRYLTTLGLIKSAADQQHTAALFFFQPILQYDDHYKTRSLAGRDEQLKARAAPEEYRRHDMLQSEAMTTLRAELGDRFTDLYDAFRGHDSEQLYADARHPNGAGNAVLAAAIYKRIETLVAPAK